jgi:hypothetical protein
MTKTVDRWFVCGTAGNIRIFDRKHQKYVNIISFNTAREAQAFVEVLEKRQSPAPLLDRDIDVLSGVEGDHV